MERLEEEKVKVVKAKALSAAEKQRRYREKLKKENPEKYQEQKKKNSERTLRNYKDKVANYSEEKKEERRQKWREDRKRNEELQNTKASSVVSEAQIIRNLQRRIEYKARQENIYLQRRLSLMMKGFKTLQMKVQRQQKEIDKMKKNYETLMMKLKDKEEAEETKETENTIQPNNENKEPDEETENTNDTYIGPDKTFLSLEICPPVELTPIKRVNEFINRIIPNVETPKKEEIKKKLVEHDLLRESFKYEYKKSSNVEKDTLKRIANSKLLKKYKQTTNLKKSLGLKISSYKKIREYQKKKVQLQNRIAAFYKRDDVSRATAGKKECRARKNIKYQKRYLLDTLKNLNKKYIAEGGKVSFSTFKKYRPFYVESPKLKDCESCACIKHCNMQFIADILKSFGLLPSNNLNEVVSNLVCDSESKDCMYDDCAACSGKGIDSGSEDLEEQVKWFKWTLTEYEYGKGENIKKSKKMMKTLIEGTLRDVVQIFNKEITAFKKHIFNFYYQYKQYKDKIENLQDHEAIIHIDFSENYMCKYHQEIQAKHFVKDQITLHTGVIYLKNEEEPITFCSISPDNTHNPESIWAHLDPVLNYIRNDHPNISTIHFFSDGPTTQYRQKKNFYLFSHKIYDYGFNHSTWSFFEAAHGKGAADGVGGAVKRTLDMKAAHGIDIPNAEAAYDVLISTETTIRIFFVPAENIKSLEESIVSSLRPLPGTMKIHQLTTCGKYKVKYRELSCFCKDASGDCECYSPAHHDFASSASNKIQKQGNRKRKNSSENNENIIENSKLKQAKRYRRKYSSTSDDDTDTQIEYAESDASDFLSDVNMSFDPDSHTDNLDKDSVIMKSCVNPNKKIQVLSTEIIKKPLTNSNASINQVGIKTTKNADQSKMKTKMDGIQQGQYCAKINDSVDKKHHIRCTTKVCTISNTYADHTYSLNTEKLTKSRQESDNLSETGNNENQKTETQDACRIMKDKNEKAKTKDDCRKKINEKTTETLNSFKINIDENLKTENQDEHKMKTDENDNKEEIESLNSCKIKKDDKTNTETPDESQINKDKKDKAEISKECEIKNDYKLKETEKDKKEIHETLEDFEMKEIDLNESTSDQETMDFQVDSSIIVRYYERKQWKYYIGFVTQIINKNNETFYKVQFLKTVKSPDLKFVATKKRDIDILPLNSVVKRVSLMPLGRAKEYFLENDFDVVYFS